MADEILKKWNIGFIVKHHGGYRIIEAVSLDGTIRETDFILDILNEASDYNYDELIDTIQLTEDIIAGAKPAEWGNADVTVHYRMESKITKIYWYTNKAGFDAPNYTIPTEDLLKMLRLWKEFVDINKE